MTLVSQEPTIRSSSPRRVRPNYHPLVLVLLGACTGIVFDRVWPLPLIVWLAGAILALAAWLILFRKERHLLAYGAVLVAVAAVGGAWHHLHWYVTDANDVAYFAGDQSQPAAIRGVALSEPRRIPAPPFDPLRAIPAVDRTQLEVRVTAARDGQDWRDMRGRAVLTVAGHLLGVHPGDELEVFANLQRIRDPGNPGELDFAAHRRADGYRCQLMVDHPACVTVLRQGSTWSGPRLLQGMRDYGEEMFWSHVHQERSGFAAALLLGSREQLDFQRTEAFFHTNTIHFLAISGAHVAILASSLFLGLRCGFLPRKAALIAVAVASTVYVLLTGAPPSAVRALVLVILVCISTLVGRPSLAFNCLAASGLIVLAINPNDLFRVGPQLSFLAVGTLAWFGPLWLRWWDLDALDRLVARTRPWPVRVLRWAWGWTWRVTIVTGAVWLTTLPLIMQQFHLVSPMAVPLTTLLWLPISVAMTSGFLVLVFGWFVPPLGLFFGWICDGSLWVIDLLVTTTAQLPGSHFWVAGPEPWWLAGFYLGLGLWAGLPQWRPRRLISLGILTLWTLVGFLAAWLEDWHEERLDCTFLSVGHGCCVVLELPDGRTILYDAGRLGSPAGGTRSIAGFLWYRGIRRIDAVILSHADVDHYNALPSLLRQFAVNKVYVSPVMFRPEADGRMSLAVRTLHTALNRAGMPVVEVSDGDLLQEGEGYALRLMHPPPEGVPGNDNANSIVLAVEYAGRRILLTGDVEGAGVDRLLSRGGYDCDVLLAPHHGSKYSNPPGFAAWSRPEWVVISGGYGVTQEMINAYRFAAARVLHTARDGAVRVRVGADALFVHHWQDGRYKEVVDAITK